MHTARPLAIALLLALANPLVHAQTDQQLADLKALFEKDPAEGFVQAAKLFETPKKAGDLEGMMKVIAVVAEPARASSYVAVLDDLTEAALAAASVRGDWAASSDLWLFRAKATRSMFHIGGCGAAPLARAVQFLEAAIEANERSGRKNGDAKAHRAAYGGIPEAAAREREQGRARRLPLLGAEITDFIASIEEAAGAGRDLEALTKLRQLMVQTRTAPLDAGSKEIAIFVSGLLWLRGAEEFLPALRQAAANSDRREKMRSDGVLYALFGGCVTAWSGHRDAFSDAISWCWDELTQYEQGNYNYFARFLRKMVFFGQATEANLLTESLVAHTLASSAWVSSVYLYDAINPQMPPGLRETLLLCNLEWNLEQVRKYDGRYSSSINASIFWEAIIRVDTPSGAQWWGSWMGVQMVEAARQLPDAERRVEVVMQAAKLFDLAKRPALAAEARALAKAMSSGDPKVQLQCAVAAAQAPAKEKKWAEVRSGLEPVVAKQKPSASLLQACLLLNQACGKLGDAAAAADYLTQAGGLVGKVGLSATERANTLVQIAGLVAEQPQRVAYLQQAQGAATEAGLELLSDKIAAQLTEAALASGDLAAAEKALLQQINRLEAKREQLAFDRLLRQQWFADNLGPYRQLLRVAAAAGKAPLALWVGEKMRGRALQDQLNWQKVDWGLKLPKAMRARLEGLREKRKQTYALLQQVLGEAAIGEDTRGAYLPIRGAYIPVRGGLEADQPVTEAQVKQLRQRIDALAKEEAAIASAVREQVPAYAEASDQKTLSGSDLLALVGKQPDLAIIEYTLCDEGLVVVATGPGQPPQVVLRPLKGEDLRQQIGNFRQQIWERKPESNDTAAQLYAQLVKPVEGCLTNAKRLWIVGDGALQLVPFGALVSADKAYLGQRLAVAMSPSLSLAFADFGKRNPGQGALVFAAPDTGAQPLAADDDKRGAYLPIRGMYLPVRGAYLPIRGEGVSSALTLMANVPLPGAQAEGEALAAKLPDAKLLTGKDATRSKLLSQGGQCDLLHIATHGYADPETPEFSGLLLSGEGEEAYAVLTAQDVYMWPLKARLVTLSACQTALGQSVEGEGLLGLTRAFIYAGAQDVLCTLWPVADESTKTLMEAFYENLKPGTPVETALQQAQLSLLQQDATKAPFYWAGFVAVRGPE